MESRVGAARLSGCQGRECAPPGTTAGRPIGAARTTVAAACHRDRSTPGASPITFASITWPRHRPVASARPGESWQWSGCGARTRVLMNSRASWAGPSVQQRAHQSPPSSRSAPSAHWTPPFPRRFCVADMEAPGVTPIRRLTSRLKAYATPGAITTMAGPPALLRDSSNNA